MDILVLALVIITLALVIVSLRKSKYSKALNRYLLFFAVTTIFGNLYNQFGLIDQLFAGTLNPFIFIVMLAIPLVIIAIALQN